MNNHNFHLYALNHYLFNILLLIILKTKF